LAGTELKLYDGTEKSYIKRGFKTDKNAPVHAERTSMESTRAFFSIRKTFIQEKSLISA